MKPVAGESADQFRPVQSGHIDAILQIEQKAYEYPWTEGLLRDCLKTNYHFYALFRQEQILAYGIMTNVLDEAHILNLCVSPQYQQNGLGTRMLKFLLDRARQLGSRTVFLEVRHSNHAAKSLYETHGFNELGRRSNYYPHTHGREDAIMYALALQTS